MSFETVDTTSATVIGYGRVDPVLSTTPSGVAIFGLRQNGVLVTEAGVPGMTAIISGRTYAEVNGPINTGLAFANPNSGPVAINFNFTDQSGNDFGEGSFTLDGNEQTAKFLDEAPFNAASFAGTFTFRASSPVGVIALRTFANQRSEFLVTTQTVTALPASISTGDLLMGHFADGAGWKTQVILVNTAEVPVSGTVQFFGEGSASAAAGPLILNVNGQVSATFTYSLRAHASANLQTSGPAGLAPRVGSVRVSPGAGSTSPAAFTIFSFTNNGVTVSQATAPAETTGTAFRIYVEVNSTEAAAGSIQSGIAITNNSSTVATVRFELTTFSGAGSGLGATVLVPAQGHISKFVHELFAGMAIPFRGILRVSSSNSIAIVSLRMRYNERGDFLITTTPASNEASPSSTADLVFPHIVDGGGYTTQFVLFSGIADQTSNGIVQFFAQDGQALNLMVR